MHMHTLISIPHDHHYALEIEALDIYSKYIHERCTDSKDNYECLDVGSLINEHDIYKWIQYIHKDANKRHID